MNVGTWQGGEVSASLLCEICTEVEHQLQSAGALVLCNSLQGTACHRIVGAIERLTKDALTLCYRLPNTKHGRACDSSIELQGETLVCPDFALRLQFL